MRFSLKIFISTLVVSMTAAGLGGYVLLSALFSSAWEREVENAAEENRMLQYAFTAWWSTVAQEETDTSSGYAAKTAKAMAASMSDAQSRFRLYGREGQVLYGTADPILSLQEREELLAVVTADTRGTLLLEQDGRKELVTVGSIVQEDGSLLYLETDRDVTALFEDRQTQYGIYSRWMAGLLAVQGAACFLMAVWLLRPLRRLSRAARRIARGDLEVRARVKSRDEVGQLAADFNRMADHLERQFAELEEAAQRQEDFIGSFAHELKTPLTSMIGYADMLRTRDLGEEERFTAANYIFQEGKRLEALSFKLLDLLVVRQGELEKRPVGTRWLGENIAGMLRPTLAKAGIAFKLVVEDAQVEMEPDLMKTVLLNLLDNGRKAIEGSGTLYLLGRREEGGYVFAVQDTGKGIPEKELSRITEAFYMVDKSRSREKGGAGLGLALCAEIVRRHGGKLRFSSTVGKGTLAWVWLPLEGGEADEA